jgi:hypothetical protein
VDAGSLAPPDGGERVQGWLLLRAPQRVTRWCHRRGMPAPAGGTGAKGRSTRRSAPQPAAPLRADAPRHSIGSVVWPDLHATDAALVQGTPTQSPALHLM